MKTGKNNFKREKAIRLSACRMFVKYKPEFESEHNAYNGDVKYYYAYLTKVGDGIQELCNMIVDRKHIGHYLFAWLYDNQNRDGDVLRAWDKFGQELSPQEVFKLNKRLRFKRKNRNRTQVQR